MSGWLIALIVVVAVFAAGGICCKTISKAQAKQSARGAAEIKK
jgi:hypothetical protein